MAHDLAEAADLVRSAKDVLLVSHIDADGISSAAISAMTCERLGKPYNVLFANKMSQDIIDSVNGSSESVVWISDLGSGYISSFTRDDVLITDHHVPDKTWKKGSQSTLFDFRKIVHINPHLYGIDGSTEVCGAGMTYLVSKEIDNENKNLAYLAVVGACGDFQDSSESRLVGLNEEILKDAVESNDVIAEDGIRFFGRETRNLIQYLQYASDPSIPGLYENSASCSAFLSELNIPVKDGDRWRSWNDLSADEMQRATKAIIDIMPEADRTRAYGGTYTLPRYPRGSDLRDSKEFATLLNSCGRYGNADVGLRICKGDESAIGDAKNNRTAHRKNIASAMSFVKQNDLLKTLDVIQYFDAGTNIPETVVGIVAGMLLNTDDVRKDLPMIGFAAADDGLKASARANRFLIGMGLDLSSVMKEASATVGGYGGGHNVAAGATIPPERKDDFLKAVESIVRRQLHLSSV